MDVYKKLNASEYFFVLFRKAHRIICCFNSLLKGLLGFCDFEFSLSQLINIHEKIGTREKSPDNRKVRIIEVRIIEVRLYILKVDTRLKILRSSTFMDKSNVSIDNQVKIYRVVSTYRLHFR